MSEPTLIALGNLLSVLESIDFYPVWTAGQGQGPCLRVCAICRWFVRSDGEPQHNKSCWVPKIEVAMKTLSKAALKTISN